MLMLNCDLGESYGSWKMGRDDEVMPHIDQANIACGFHAGDPTVMKHTISIAQESGVAVGAHARDDLVAPHLADLARLDDTAFRALFSGSPIKRIGRARFLRNVCYAMGNSGEPSHSETLRALTGDPDPVLADAARWALERLR